jgi:hypothetical protein
MGDRDAMEAIEKVVAAAPVPPSQLSAVAIGDQRPWLPGSVIGPETAEPFSQTRQTFGRLCISRTAKRAGLPEGRLAATW